MADARVALTDGETHLQNYLFGVPKETLRVIPNGVEDVVLNSAPWARTAFKDRASYCPVTHSTRQTARALRQFYDAAPQLPAPPKPLSWTEVAQQVKALGGALLAESGSADRSGGRAAQATSPHNTPG